MLFSSITFLFLFLPVVCAVYFLVPKRLKNDVLLAASFVFYAWGEPHYVFIMILSVFINYAGALLIEKTNFKKLFLVLTVVLNLTFLGYFKYFNFLIENLNLLLRRDVDPLQIIMPIGISFYTFQAMSYVVDVYRKTVSAQKNIYDLALYIMLFPQLVAGPIVKYHDIADQINDREENIDKVYRGILRFIGGLAKKVMIANTLGAVADEIFASDLQYISAPLAWIGAAAYMFQIYFDFSGYSDMAIGLCLVFGFKIPENFNYPYISKSITEFWRRWHISLSTWFKQYLYIPLGGSRVSKTRTAVNLMIVFLVTGFWHGASWNFILWGLWHGCFIVIEKLSGLNTEKPGIFRNMLLRGYALLVVVIGWVMFRADTLPAAAEYLKKMFGLIPDKYAALDLVYYVDGQELLAFAFAVLLSTPAARHFFDVSGKYRSAAVQIIMLALFLISSAMIAAGTYNPFIYFRF